MTAPRKEGGEGEGFDKEGGGGGGSSSADLNYIVGKGNPFSIRSRKGRREESPL